MYAIATTPLRLVLLLGGLASSTACELIPSRPCSLGAGHLRATHGSAPCRARIDDIDPTNAGPSATPDPDPGPDPGPNPPG